MTTDPANNPATATVTMSIQDYQVLQERIASLQELSLQLTDREKFFTIYLNRQYNGDERMIILTRDRALLMLAQSYDDLRRNYISLSEQLHDWHKKPASK